jgi:hypothetical protein
MVNIYTIEAQVRHGSMELQYVDLMVEKEGTLSDKQRLEYHPTIDMTLNTTTSPITVTPPANYDGIASLNIHFTNSLVPEKLYKTRFGSSTIVWSSVDLFDCKMNKGDQFRIWNSDMTSSIVVEYAGKGALYIEDGETKACIGDSYLGFTWGGAYNTPDGKKLGIPVALVMEIENE